MENRFGVHSEYGKLREVVVGILDDFTLPPFGPGLEHYNPELRAALEATGGRPLNVWEAMPERMERASRQLENIVATYREHGVAVRRPRPYSEAEKAYLDNLQEGHSGLYAADPVFVVGNHFIELNIRRAYRRKEVFPLREAVLPLIADDPDAHHVAVPHATPFAPSAEGPGPFLEGGDILIRGKDIIVGRNDQLCSNQAGIEWLARYIEPHGYRVHPMPVEGNILHGLGVLCLIREGLALAYLPAIVDGLPEPIRDWEIVSLSAEEASTFATVGVSLDQRTYMIDDRNTRVIDELDKRGVTPVPLPAADLGFFGGDIRCATLPVARDAE